MAPVHPWHVWGVPIDRPEEGSRVWELQWIGFVGKIWKHLDRKPWFWPPMIGVYDGLRFPVSIFPQTNPMRTGTGSVFQNISNILLSTRCRWPESTVDIRYAPLSSIKGLEKFGFRFSTFPSNLHHFPCFFSWFPQDFPSFSTILLITSPCRQWRQLHLAQDESRWSG